MDERDELLYEPIFFGKIIKLTEDLATIINQNMGMRIGQSTVCSQKMHTFHPQNPQEVNILQDIDAGQSFYNRKESGSIYHLDIFHECGLVDHHIAAAFIRTAVERYNEYYDKYIVNGNDNKVADDFFDIQTGTGGGSITGSLNYGKKLSLRKGHTNHVHITMVIPPKHLACMVYVVIAVETAILSCNLELRRNEKIEHVKGRGKGKIDLSAYGDKSDSLLQQHNSSGIFDRYGKNQDDVDLMDKLKTVQELQEYWRNNRHGVEGVAQKGIIELNDTGESVTDFGKHGNSFFESYIPEIEIHLRQVVQNAKKNLIQTSINKKLQQKIHCPGGQNLLNHIKVGHEFGEVNISESISAAACRMVEKNEKKFKITYEDLRYSLNHKRRKIAFCLLIDASSSMEGQRIRAAKQLARFLFMSTADCISVIVFQENRAWIQVPFTRDLQQLEERLEEIKAYGETPLALGLTACIEYLEKKSVHNPLIILITDGVPTLGTMTSDPVHDALEVAKHIRIKKYGFTCIGLKPHLDYLNQLSKITGGSIYAIDELERVGMY